MTTDGPALAAALQELVIDAGLVGGVLLAITREARVFTVTALPRDGGREMLITVLRTALEIAEKGDLKSQP